MVKLNKDNTKAGTSLWNHAAHLCIAKFMARILLRTSERTSPSTPANIDTTVVLPFNTNTTVGPIGTDLSCIGSSTNEDPKSILPTGHESSSANLARFNAPSRPFTSPRVHPYTRRSYRTIPQSSKRKRVAS